MRKYKFVDKMSGQIQDRTLIIYGDGTFDAEPKEEVDSFAGMVRWMGKDPKPESIYDFIKSGLRYTDVLRLDDSGNLVALTDED